MSDRKLTLFIGSENISMFDEAFRELYEKEQGKYQQECDLRKRGLGRYCPDEEAEGEGKVKEVVRQAFSWDRRLNKKIRQRNSVIINARKRGKTFTYGNTFEEFASL